MALVMTCSNSGNICPDAVMVFSMSRVSTTAVTISDFFSEEWRTKRSDTIVPIKTPMNNTPYSSPFFLFCAVTSLVMTLSINTRFGAKSFQGKCQSQLAVIQQFKQGCHQKNVRFRTNCSELEKREIFLPINNFAFSGLCSNSSILSWLVVCSMPPHYSASAKKIPIQRMLHRILEISPKRRFPLQIHPIWMRLP